MDGYPSPVSKRQKYDLDPRYKQPSPDRYTTHYRPPSPDEHELYDLQCARGPATPPSVMQQPHRRYSNYSVSPPMHYTSRSPTPIAEPEPVKRRRVSISPPARYKKDYYNKEAESSSSSDEELSEPYEVEHRKSRMLKNGLGARLWTQWEQHREMCCLSHSYFVKHLLTLHRKHCQWVNSLTQDQSSDSSPPPVTHHRRRKKKKKHKHKQQVVVHHASLSPTTPTHNPRYESQYSHPSDDMHSERSRSSSHRQQPPQPHYQYDVSPPHSMGGGGRSVGLLGNAPPPNNTGRVGLLPHPIMPPRHMPRNRHSFSPPPDQLPPPRYDVRESRYEDRFDIFDEPPPMAPMTPQHPGGGGGGRRPPYHPHPAVEGHVMMRGVTPDIPSRVDRKPPPARRTSSSDESGQVSETSSMNDDDALMPGGASGGLDDDDVGGSADGPRLNRSGVDIGICIRNLPLRSSDTSLRDGLFHEYKRHGKVTSVNIFDIGQNRYAVVSFRKPEQMKEALEESKDKVFFGSKITVESHCGFECDDAQDSPSEAELDEYHIKATRTLFVGNLDKDISTQSLNQLFSPFGEILDIDIKCPYQGAVTAYAFIQYPEIRCVVKAQQKFNVEAIGPKTKLGFGKSMPSGTVWLDCLPESVTVDMLGNMFSRYGMVHFIFIDKPKGQALIFYEDLEAPKRAVNDVRGRVVDGSRIQVDYASRECEDHFFDRLESSGQLMEGERPSIEARNALQKPAMQSRSQQNYQQNRSRGGGSRY